MPNLPPTEKTRGLGKVRVPGQHLAQWGRREGMAKHQAMGFTPQWDIRLFPPLGPPAPSCCGHRAGSFLETLLKDTGPGVGNAPWLCKGLLKPEAHLPPSRLHTMWFK